MGSFFDSPEHLRAPTGADVHLRELMKFSPLNFVPFSFEINFLKDRPSRLDLLLSSPVKTFGRLKAFLRQEF